MLNIYTYGNFPLFSGYTLMFSNRLTWSEEMFSILRAPAALCGGQIWDFFKKKIEVALIRKFCLCFSFCDSSRCPYISDGSHRRASGSGSAVANLSGTIAHWLRVFCHGGALHQSNGEYFFHCALKDHNLEMLWAINNFLSCMLNETCILLDVRGDQNKSRLMKKPLSSSHIRRTQVKRMFTPVELFFIAGST